MKDESYYMNFIGAEKIEIELLPYIADYTFPSIIRAIFAITSWRNNRGAQRSCLSLNSALSKCERFGDKTIDSYIEFKDFFDRIKGILSISYIDDPVVRDFGEIKLLFDNEYYPVITGTGHSFPVFSALQFLEPIAKINHSKKRTITILNYFRNMLEFLYELNGNATNDTSPCFECPTESFFCQVKEFFKNESWKSIATKDLSVLDIKNCSVDRSHFIKYLNDYYPLFNPSFVFDYYFAQLSSISEEEINTIVKKTVIEKVNNFYVGNGDYSTVIKKVGFVSNSIKQPWILSNSFLFLSNDLAVIFTDIENIDEDVYYNQIENIEFAHKNGELLALDFEKRKQSSVKAINIRAEQRLFLINYTNYIGSNLFSFQTHPNACTALDLMFMLLFSNKISDICNFFELRNKHETQILSLGGLADYFSNYMECGELNKGAVQFSIASFECDSAASYIYDKYLDYYKWFPFDLKQFAPPEKYIIENRGDSKYSLWYKADPTWDNYFITLSEGIRIFTQYNMLNCCKAYPLKDAELKMEFLCPFINDFFTVYKHEIINTNCFKGKTIHLICSSISENVPDDKYFVFHNVTYKMDQIFISFSADVDKIMKEINQSTNRSIELKAICDLFSPFFAYSKEFELFFSELKNEYSLYKKTINTTGYELEYYYNPDTVKFYQSTEDDNKVRKIIAKEVLQDNIVSGKYGGKDATKIIRPIQVHVFQLMIGLMREYNALELHLQLLSLLASEQFELYIKRKNYELSEDLSESFMKKSKSISNDSYIESKNNVEVLRYLIEANLSIDEERNGNTVNYKSIQELFSYANWLVSLQNNADLCYNIDFCDNEDFITQISVLDDYRIHIETGNEFFNKNKSQLLRMQENSILIFDESTLNEEYIKKFYIAFQNDTGINHEYFYSFLCFLYTLPYFDSIKNDCEVIENVISISLDSLYEEAKNLLDDSFTEEIISSILDFLTIDVSHIMDFRNKKSELLPIWERENRPNRFETKPLYLINDRYIYSPITIYELSNRWWNGVPQFFLPYEKGLKQSIDVLTDWKSQYEHLFSKKISELFKSHGFEYADYDIDIRKRDRKGGHPIINELGDYDVLGLDKTNHKIFIIECKFLQKISTVFEHSKEQHRFFFKEKFDEKFQKRIDYFSKVYRSYFQNQGIILENDAEYEIVPLMVVNKVFVSYYKHVRFPIITYDELVDLL